MVNHVINIEVTSNTNSSYIDIIKSDNDSNNLIINLRYRGEYHNISGLVPLLYFYDEESETVVNLGRMSIINPCRGQLSYIVGGRLASHAGRYIMNISLVKQEDADTYEDDEYRIVAKESYTFIINVIESQVDTDTDLEIPFLESKKEEINSHMTDEDLHLNESDRSIIRWVLENKDKLEELIEDHVEE